MIPALPFASKQSNGAIVPSDLEVLDEHVRWRGSQQYDGMLG